ncbi:3-hydroxybenzoate 6-monooxygenase [Pseudonocardia yunnanensis]|uniref:FAD-dependent monooxygenase n=1 Tax=Pseudonocardia yunnanensis TaxID=58107 RepID=A0ABW4ETG6_9PSEU
MNEAIIVGGGIGGLAAAIALQKSGSVGRIQVLEQAAEFGELGAGVQLAPNALRALQALGVYEGIDRYAVYPRRLVMMDAVTGSFITALDVGAPFRERFGMPYLLMHRGDLLRMLIDRAKQFDAIELRSAVHVTGVEPDGSGARVVAATGEDLRGDLVVGADGLRSVVRTCLLGDARPVSGGCVAYRGTVPFDHVASIADGDDVLLWVGPGMHLVQYPIRRGELYNQVVTFRSERHSPDDDWGTEDELDERFAAACDAVRAGVDLIDRGRRWKLVDRDPVDSWVRGRIALIGDAAHPMVQYVGQGAAQTLEDAVSLSAAVGAEPDLDTALARYQRERVPRASRVQGMARRFGEVLHAGGMAATMRDRLLTSRSHADYSEIEWLYG